MKSITINTQGMTKHQQVEALLYSMRHDEKFNKVKCHTWAGKYGSYKIHSNKTIRASLQNG